MIDYETYFKNAEKILRGLTSLEVALGLVHITKAIYNPLLQDAKAKTAAFALTREARTDAFITLREKRSDGDVFLRDVRNHLTGPLGATWSPVWAPLGFINGSLALPDTDAGRCQMLDKINTYFTNHPGHENATEDYTAARAAALCIPMTNAVGNVEDSKFQARTQRDARDTAIKLLDKKTAALRNELETVLEPTDPRWLKFFDRIPGDLRVPEPVAELTATPRPGGVIDLDWPDATRATHYRVLKQIVGTDAELVLADTVEDSQAHLTGVPPGAIVKLQIVPLNGVGPGAGSEVIELRAA